MLSHYTNCAGLEGVARSKTLWATNFQELNDTSEMEYGFIELNTRALRAAIAEVESHSGRADAPISSVIESAKERLKEHFRKSYGTPGVMSPLYVVSFVRSRNEDQERRGLLTLWDRYTRLEGYCLQYDVKEVEEFLLQEFMKRSYGILELVDVRYGFDESDKEYQELLFQLRQYALVQFKQMVPRLGIEIDSFDLFEENELGMLLIRAIAMHKDPFFEDERETRIIAVPAKPGGIPVCGLSQPKEKRKTSGGRSYIELGEDWRPAIEPRRIIVGPRANSDIADILALFDRKPEVINATFPIRG
jgi:hypothetical protein